MSFQYGDGRRTLMPRHGYDLEYTGWTYIANLEYYCIMFAISCEHRWMLTACLYFACAVSNHGLNCQDMRARPIWQLHLPLENTKDTIYRKMKFAPYLSLFSNIALRIDIVMFFLYFQWRRHASPAQKVKLSLWYWHDFVVDFIKPLRYSVGAKLARYVTGAECNNVAFRVYVTPYSWSCINRHNTLYKILLHPNVLS